MVRPYGAMAVSGQRTRANTTVRPYGRTGTHRVKMPRILYRYIFRELVETFVLAMVAYGFVMTLGSVFQVLQSGLGVMFVVRIVPYVLPHTLPWTVPISVLTACVVAYGRLSSENEVLAMNALGVHPVHVLAPALVLAAMALVPLLYCNHFIEPQSNEARSATLKEAALTSPFSLLSLDEPVFGLPGLGVRIYIGEAVGNRLTNVIIFRSVDVKRDSGKGAMRLAPGEFHVIYAREATYEITGKGSNRELHLTLRNCESKYVNRAEPFGYNLVKFDVTSEVISLAEKAFTPGGWKDMTTPELLVELAVQSYLRRLANLSTRLPEPEHARYGREQYETFKKIVGRSMQFSKDELDATEAAEKANSGGSFEPWNVMQAYAGVKLVEPRKLNDILTRIRMRWASGLDVLGLALLGVPLGILTRKGRKLIGFGISVLVVTVLYFPLVVSGKALSTNGVFGAPLWPYASSIVTGTIGVILTARQR